MKKTMNEEYILATMEGNKIIISATGKPVTTEESAAIRDEFIVTRQDEPNLEAMLRRRISD
jgi:hypothetical protein